MSRIVGSNRKNIEFWLLPTVASFVFVLIANQVWEDYLITFRHSRNLVDGLGLVYNAGERVHGFTSFFNTLIPAFFELFNPTRSIYPVLWVYRLLCIFLLAVSCWYIGKMVHRKAGILCAWAVVGLVALDIRIISFTTNGQEIAFMIAGITWALLLIEKGIHKNWLQVGLCAAALQYTRPDGFVYASVLFGAPLLFGNIKWREGIISLLKAVAVCALVYGPWLAWTWIYYGSPVPHTVIAKSGAYLEVQHPSLLGFFPQSFSLLTLTIIEVFRPVYCAHLLDSYSMVIWAFVVGSFGTFYWFFPKAGVVGRTASFSFFIMCFYLSFLDYKSGIIFPWYKPAVAYLGYVSFALALGDLRRIFSKFRGSSTTVYICVASLLAWGLLNFSAGTIQLTVQQNVIEEKVRKPIGIWLRDNASSVNDTVLLEPIGYIGFYSNLKILDWPGLVSEEVVASRERNQNDFMLVVQDLKPDWLVVRPARLFVLSSDAWVKEHYEIVKIFDVIDQLDAIPILPGARFPYFDAKYFILKRKPDGIS